MVWLVILDWIDLSSFNIAGVDIIDHLFVFDYALRGRSKKNYIILIWLDVVRAVWLIRNNIFSSGESKGAWDIVNS